MKLSFKLLILFLLLLYSNIAIAFPQLDALRPVLLVAASAMVMMFIELGQSRQTFRMMWPQGILLISFLAALLCFWTVNGVGLIWAQTAVVNLLSGALVPLAFFPYWLRAFAAWAPFQGIIATPLAAGCSCAVSRDCAWRSRSPGSSPLCCLR